MTMDMNTIITIVILAGVAFFIYKRVKAPKGTKGTGDFDHNTNEKTIEK
jgi:hypothetical protein